MGNRVIIQPYSARLHNNNPNPKNFPHWEQVVNDLNNLGYEVIQVGVKGEGRVNGVSQMIVGWPLKHLRQVVADAETFVAVDSFFQHFVHVECGAKRGVVIFSQSDPAIWGHPENINLLRDRSCLRQYQFASWHEAQYNADLFPSAADVVAAVVRLAPLATSRQPQSLSYVPSPP